MHELTDDEWSSLWHEGMQCALLSFEVDRRGYTVTLRLSRDGCTDMAGAIRFATGLWPGVSRIVCANQSDPYEYVRSDGDWQFIQGAYR